MWRTVFSLFCSRTCAPTNHVCKPAQFNKSNGDNLLKMPLPVDNCCFMPEPSTGKKGNSLLKMIIFRSAFERLFQHMQLLVEFVVLMALT